MPGMVSHSRQRRMKREKEHQGKMEARQTSPPSSRLQRGSGQSSPKPFQGVGMGENRPQAARDRQGTGDAQHAPPHTLQTPKWRLALAAARLCPGTGWGWGRQGAKPNATRLGMVAASL